MPILLNEEEWSETEWNRWSIPFQSTKMELFLRATVAGTETQIDNVRIPYFLEMLPVPLLISSLLQHCIYSRMVLIRGRHLILPRITSIILIYIRGHLDDSMNRSEPSA